MQYVCANRYLSEFMIRKAIFYGFTTLVVTKRDSFYRIFIMSNKFDYPILSFIDWKKIKEVPKVIVP